ncbi:hypothetical protein M408DRAFT_332748 [Serendipita vermifera MAFF 305830]|uniref:Membrane-associated protein n=1 Tax=Serendipita vermifera MAFF 305830 TaxID=933852 RepID=A0A0C3ADT2_SERVB|nr:hypothetical protein M408DRAFT_332748 [Serendipita vermifera MAFF 305830]
MLSRILHIIALLVILPCVASQMLTNITIDDSDPMISYSGSWSTQYNSDIAYGGSYHSSNDSSASATLTFDGVAVYVLAPRFPDSVSIWIQLDGGIPSLLEMGIRYGMTTSTNVSTALWGVSGLSDTRHVLVVTGQTPSFITDGFIYTTQTKDATSSSSTGTHLSPTTLAVSVSLSVTFCFSLIIFIVIMIRRRRTAFAHLEVAPFPSVDDVQTTATPGIEATMTTHENTHAAILTPGLPPLHSDTTNEMLPSAERTNRTPPMSGGSDNLTSPAATSKSRFTGSHIQRRWSDQSLAHARHLHLQRALLAVADSQVEAAEPPPSYYLRTSSIVGGDQTEDSPSVPR